QLVGILGGIYLAFTILCFCVCAAGLSLSWLKVKHIILRTIAESFGVFGQCAIIFNALFLISAGGVGPIRDRGHLGDIFVWEVHFLSTMIIVIGWDLFLLSNNPVNHLYSLFHDNRTGY
ncbi:hypothetical protein ACJX0J_023462, partial [Zea mays]